MQQYNDASLPDHMTPEAEYLVDIKSKESVKMTLNIQENNNDSKTMTTGLYNKYQKNQKVK